MKLSFFIIKILKKYSSKVKAFTTKPLTRKEIEIYLKKDFPEIEAEFKRPQKELQEFEKKLDEYWLCYSPTTRHNEVLIAVKEDLTEEPIIEEW